MQNKGRETRMYIDHWYVVVAIFAVSIQRKDARVISFLPLLQQNCCRGIFHAFMFSRTMVFLSGGGKKRSSIELSNNISERRCELKANEPVSEHSERASGYATDLLLGERSEASGKSGVYYILQLLLVEASSEQTKRLVLQNIRLKTGKNQISYLLGLVWK